MLRVILGVVGGFFAWSVVWVGSERVLSALMPEWFGSHQAAFEAAVAGGGQFTADTTILLTNLVRGSLVSIMAGFLAALIAGENRRAPLVLSLFLVAFGLIVVFLSWAYVPVWYHILFTAMLIPMTMLGGRLRTAG